ncbi:MAG: SAM-dependent chlorinase/fluorinase [Anaerolineales bacterium]|nr:SAM-dependent chlorinase/fluorinase [Anaerolineales bacterium]
MKQPLIALLTDFGTSDPYVGIMKGILASISPETRFIDLTNHIPPGDIQRGAFALWQSSLDLPSGTIFLAVVDPGVGTERKAICLDCAGQRFIGPDNGLFSFLLYGKEYHAWELSNPAYQLSTPGSTFHGRDIFAPAAAHAANGIPGEKFGNPVKSIKRLAEPILELEGNSLSGEVLSSDRFGNLSTSLGHFHSKDSWDLILSSWINQTKCKTKDRSCVEILVKDKTLPLVKTFSSIPEGNCAGLIGSTGLLEIVCNLGSAKDILGLKRGDPILLRW